MLERTSWSFPDSTAWRRAYPREVVERVGPARSEDRRDQRIEDRFDALEQRFDALEQRLDGLRLATIRGGSGIIALQLAVLVSVIVTRT